MISKVKKEWLYDKERNFNSKKTVKAGATKFRTVDGNANTIAKRFVLFPILFGVAFLLLGWLAKSHVSTFTVQSVKIESELHNSQAHEIEKILVPYVQGDFFKVDLSSAQQAVENLSWVRHASLKRQWPNTIYVSIVEQVPVAIWNNGTYLNSEANVFEMESTDYQELLLPSLTGPSGTEALMLTEYYKLEAMLKETGLIIEELILDDRYSWSMKLKNNILVNIGIEDIDFRLQRFLLAYKQLFSQSFVKVSSIDLRYSNGIAIKWDKSDNDFLNKYRQRMNSDV